MPSDRLTKCLPSRSVFSRQLSVAAVRLASDLPAKSDPSAASVPGMITVEGVEDLSAISGHPAEEVRRSAPDSGGTCVLTVPVSVSVSLRET